MPEVTVKDVHKMLQKIVDNQNAPAVNYAVEYAKYGMTINNAHDLHHQILYVLSNITRWRGATAVAVRTVLKAFHP